MELNELVVISGKGGTGKTSLVASFAALSGETVLADCDVDASNLHLLVQPDIVTREPFTGSVRAVIEPDLCSACGICEQLCRFEAITSEGGENGIGGSLFPQVNRHHCEGCGVCAWFCPEQAIELVSNIDGEVLLSKTRFGPMAHARLGVAGENSGKLVSRVREEARTLAKMREIETILVDGSPGIGCPVIASLTGADLALVVTEPTVSGIHDLERITELSVGFDIPTLVCVNRWDINPEITDQIEAWTQTHDMLFAGRIRYDATVSRAQLAQRTIVEEGGNGCVEDIRKVWSVVHSRITGLKEEFEP